MPTPSDHRQLEIFVALEQRARAAQSVAELAFIIANETIALLPFTQAVIFESDGTVVCISGVSVSERNGPFALFLKRIGRDMCSRHDSIIAGAWADLLPSEQHEWRQWLSNAAMWVPPSSLGWGLLITRDEPWSDFDVAWLNRLAEVFGHARTALKARRHRLLPRMTTGKSTRRMLIMGLMACSLIIPVRLTVLAPAEVVAANAFVIRSPIDGIIEKIHVVPNQVIEAGQELVDLDVTTVSNKLDVAQKELIATEIEYRQTSQLAVMDLKARAQMAIIASRIDIRVAEVAYLKTMIERAHIRAPKRGIAVLDEPYEMIGRPISFGEKILSLADEQDVEIEAWVGLSDVIDFSKDGGVFVTLNSEPLKLIYARIRYLSYEPLTRADGTSGYRLRASFMETTNLPRLGLRGNARLDGEKVTAAYWLFRRPLGVLRTFFGI